jgi:hypothetical protein
MIYTSSGPQLAWIAELVVVLVTLGLWFVFYHRMVPIEERYKNGPGNNNAICKNGDANHFGIFSLKLYSLNLFFITKL